MGQNFIKFYPSDWRSDPGLQECSLAAKGLWIELMCLMAESDQYGVLRVSPGDETGMNRVAKRIHAGMKAFRPALAELEQAGVFSRTSEGYLYSRRMVRDHKRRAESQEFGKTGGNPALKAKPQDGITQTLNPDGIRGEDKGSCVRALAPSQKPESRSQKENTQPPPVKTADPRVAMVVARFLELRRNLWQGEHDLTASPTLTLNAQAEGYLANGADATAICESITRSMERMHEQGKTCPTSLRAFHKSVGDIAPAPTISPPDNRSPRQRAIERYTALRKRNLDIAANWPEAWGLRPGLPGSDVTPDVIAEVEATLKAKADG